MMDDDLKDYLAGTSPEERERLDATLAVLRSVPDEEVPRRISFVSDKVFEPKWWQRFPVWGMASVAMLSAAVLAHGYVSRPVIYQTVNPAPMAAVAPVADTKALEAQFNKRLDAEIKKVSTEYDHRLEFERRAIMLAVEDNFNLMRKQMNIMVRASAESERESAQ